MKGSTWWEAEFIHQASWRESNNVTCNKVGEAIVVVIRVELFPGAMASLL